LAKKQKNAKAESCWVSALSATPQIPVDILPAMVPSGPVDVYLLGNNDPIGKAVAYEIREDTLWARVEIKRGLEFSRAMCLVNGATTPPRIAAIVLTSVSRETLNHLRDNFGRGGERAD